MKSGVALAGAGNYDYREVKAKVRGLIESLGMAGDLAKPGESVLLKPNMLASAPPEKAVTTHPAVVKAVAELVMEAGGKPFIADSPAIAGFGKVARACGIAEVAEELDIPAFGLHDSVEQKQDEKKVFRILEVSRHALEADRIINLPKLKTHTQMYMTLGVKNVFGCVVGKRKGQWHLKAGVDRFFFARMLVELYQTVSPSLTILDGILGMEGDGPGPGGVPRHIGVLAASADAVALDRVILEIVGGRPEMMFTNAIAAETGAGETDMAGISLCGEEIGSFRVDNFVFPKMEDVVPVHPMVRKFMVNRMTPKPREDRDKCTLCNQCVEICPTKVITNAGERLAFDYDKCIRCFCCVEICPEGAMKPHKPWLSRLIG